MNEEYGIYHVGLKVLLRDNDNVLLLIDKPTGRIDLPGGRISAREADVRLEEILRREIREELGGEVQYNLHGPLFQFRRYNVQKNARVLLTVYGGIFLGGDIQLSDEHASYEWVDPKKREFVLEDFGGEEEFAAMTGYFQNRF